MTDDDVKLLDDAITPFFDRMRERTPVLARERDSQNQPQLV